MSVGCNLDVLLVEDNAGDARLVVEALRAEAEGSFQVHHVNCLNQAVERLGQMLFDVILVDLNLPDANGLEAVERLIELCPTAPVLILSGDNDEALAIMALHSGAQDFLVKGLAASENLSRSIRFACERKIQRDELAHLARIDAVTGLPNRMQFDEYLPKTLSRMERSGGTCALFYLDLNSFKPINDTMGHQAGDVLLRGVAERLAACLRRGDMVCRIGGDEFALILEGITGAKGAVAAANKIGATLTKPFVLGGVSVGVSASIGVALYPQDAEDVSTLIQKADDAMYLAKRECWNFALSGALDCSPAAVTSA